MANPPDRETTRPLPTLGGVEAGNDNAPSADRIVCRGRAGARVAPPRASVLDGRQPTEREEAAAVGGSATSQGGVWIRIASSGRADVAGQRTVSFASLAWRAVCLLADAPMLPGWDASGRGHWAQLRRDHRPLPHRAGERHTKPRPLVRPGLVLLGASPPTGCAAAARWRHLADAPNRRTARSLTTFVADTQVTGGLPGTAVAAWAGGRRGTYGPEESGRSPVVGWADSCHTVAWFTLGRRWRCKVPGDCS
jgi:hypothetical protein